MVVHVRVQVRVLCHPVRVVDQRRVLLQFLRCLRVVMHPAVKSLHGIRAGARILCRLSRQRRRAVRRCLGKCRARHHSTEQNETQYRGQRYANLHFHVSSWGFRFPNSGLLTAFPNCLHYEPNRVQKVASNYLEYLFFNSLQLSARTAMASASYIRHSGPVERSLFTVSGSPSDVAAPKGAPPSTAASRSGRPRTSCSPIARTAHTLPGNS